MIDTGAARSMIHVSMLKNAKYKIAGPIDKNYVSASGDTLRLYKSLIDICIPLPQTGPYWFRKVLVSLSRTPTNTFLIGTPDIIRMGLILNYNNFTFSINKGLYKGHHFRMETNNGSRVKNVAELDSELKNQQVEDLFDSWIQSVSETETDLESVKSTNPICGDPCIYTQQPCQGCEKCIDQKLKSLLSNEMDPPLMANPNVDGKTALNAYIERIRQHDRSTYSHNDCTIDDNLKENHPDIAAKLKVLINKYKNVFAGDIGKISDVYAINGKMSGTTSPQRPGHSEFTGQTLQAVIKQFAKLIAHGVLVNVQEHNITPINKMNILPVKKKDDEGNVLKVLSALRLVLDSRITNSQTLFCGAQTDNLNDALHFAARTSKYGFNLKADIADAYYTIPLHKDLWPYFCVTIPILGTYCFTRLVQGWAPAAQWCQETLTRIFFPLHQYLRKYMDDLVLAAINKNDYLTKVEHFLKICQNSGLRLKGKKCFFGATTFNFLGHTIKRGLITASPHYVLKLLDINHSSINLKTDLRSFAQSVAYLGKFTNHSTAILNPLREASKGDKNEKVVWTESLIAAFYNVKLALKELSELHPFDPDKETILVVDTCKSATGGFLYQKDEVGPKLVQFFSRARRDKERKIPLSSCHMELLGLKSMIIALLYLLRQCTKPITVVTDSRSLVKVFEKFKKHDIPSHDTLLNNAMYSILSVLDVNVIHAKNTNTNIKFADDLSRLKILKTGDQCNGTPKCTICLAADPSVEDRGAFIDHINKIDKMDKNIGNIFDQSFNDDPCNPSDKLSFSKTQIFNPAKLLSVKPKEMRYTVEQFLSQNNFIADLQLRCRDLKSIRNAIQNNKVSFPKRQQRLHTLLVTRNAILDNNILKLDKIIDGVTYKVIPLPPSAAILAISAVHNTIGHQSVNQLLKQTVRLFQFENMRSKIQDFAAKCLKCTLLKGGGNPNIKISQKAVPLANDFYQTILVDEVTRTFRNKTIKFLLAMESLSGFMALVHYDKSMTGPKFIQCMAQIKSILCPHGFQGTKISIRCDQATWHTSKAVHEALAAMNIDLIFYTSESFSKNIIPELDAKIKIFGQYLAQIVEDNPWDLLTCSFAAIAKVNGAIGQNGRSPAELFTGRGWLNKKTIQIDTNQLLRDIQTKRKNRRDYEERQKLKRFYKNEAMKLPYKNAKLNSALLRNPEILDLQVGDKITIKDKINKNIPRCGYMIEELNFSTQKAKVFRCSGRDDRLAASIWITFDVIDKIFKSKTNLDNEISNIQYKPLIPSHKMTQFLTGVQQFADLQCTPPEIQQEPQFFNESILADFPTFNRFESLTDCEIIDLTSEPYSNEVIDLSLFE